MMENFRLQKVSYNTRSLYNKLGQKSFCLFLINMIILKSLQNELFFYNDGRGVVVLRCAAKPNFYDPLFVTGMGIIDLMQPAEIKYMIGVTKRPN